MDFSFLTNAVCSVKKLFVVVGGDCPVLLFCTSAVSRDSPFKLHRHAFDPGASVMGETTRNARANLMVVLH